MTRSLSNFFNRSPLREDLFDPLQQVFDEFYDGFFDNSVFDKVKTMRYPKMDVVTEDGYLKVKVAVPGVSKENVKVEILPDNSLKVSGQMSEEYKSPEKDAKYHIRELKMSSFSRVVKLPDWVKEDPEASMKDAILVLKWRLPELKKEEPPKIESRVVEIKD